VFHVFSVSINATKIYKKILNKEKKVDTFG